MVSDQLQRLVLWLPGPQGSVAAAGLEVAGQRLGGPHGPDPRCRPWRAGDQSAVAACKHVADAFHLKAGIGAHPAVGGHRQSTGCEPVGRSTAGAEQAGDVPSAVVAVHQFHLRRHQDLTLWVLQLSGPALQLQRAPRPASAQGQHHFQTRGPGPDHAEGRPAVRVLRRQECQGRLQRFDRHARAGTGPADGSHIQAEQAVADRRTVVQLQLLPLQVHAPDLRLHEGDARAIAQLA